MDYVVALNDKTDGRDKIARFVQYGSKAAWHYMEKNNVDIKSIEKIKQLEKSLATFRQLLRFGRFIESLQAALRTVNHSDRTIRFCVTFSKIGNSLYLLCDHFLWLNKNNFVQLDNKKWGRVGQKYWLMAIVLNLVKDAMELNSLLKAILRNKILNTINRKVTPKPVFTGEAVQFVCSHKYLFIDIAKNSCDLMLPLTNLGIVRLSPGTVGVVGMVSSVLNLYVMMNQRARLPYS